MKFINKSDVEETTLNNYDGRLVRMEVYLKEIGLGAMLVANDDGTVKEYDEATSEQIEADAYEVLAHYGENCISVSVVETYEAEKVVCYIEEYELYNYRM